MIAVNLSPNCKCGQPKVDGSRLCVDCLRIAAKRMMAYRDERRIVVPKRHEHVDQKPQTLVFVSNNRQISSITLSRTFTTPLPLRFLTKIVTDPLTNCWNWTGSTWGLPGYLYGQITVWDSTKQGKERKRRTTAHRFAYECVHGRVSRQLDIDHLCHNKLCVNPEHLEAVSHQENILRRPR